MNVVNCTDKSCTLRAKLNDQTEWEHRDSLNPEVTYSDKYPALSKWHVDDYSHFETAYSPDSVIFTMTVTFANYEDLVFELDARDVACYFTHIQDRPSQTVTSSTGERYTVLQVITQRQAIDNGDLNYNKLTVYITPFVDPKRWMERCQDQTLMALNIPGSHDSATYDGDGEEGTRCQQIDFQAQLEAGIRFFDLRLIYNPTEKNPNGEMDLGLFHGHYFQNVWLKKDILPDVNDFLAKNPSECVIFCVKRETSDGEDIDEALHTVLMENLPANGLYDANDPTIFDRTLENLKGCVILLRRDQPRTYGLDVSNWPNNSAYSSFECPAPQVIPSSETPRHPAVATGKIELQDAYAVSAATRGIAEKWPNVKAHLDRASSGPLVPLQWYMNWTNASLSTLPVLGSFPWDYASCNFDSTDRAGMPGPNGGINFLLCQYFVQNLDKVNLNRFGTVVMDYPDVPQNMQLIQLLLSMNARLRTQLPSRPEHAGTERPAD
ncbi:phosphatidylinositol-specific phospholipase C domain-containing protein [Nocardia sp. NPDC020380]|uniref:phosphatidylinositol-specific phospholipase C domain-containing protein n=1 Tax=Nocardia sp. NPDC020380 TaxID=3364309 RepID=UPI0037A3E1D0